MNYFLTLSDEGDDESGHPLQIGATDSMVSGVKLLVEQKPLVHALRREKGRRTVKTCHINIINKNSNSKC